MGDDVERSVGERSSAKRFVRNAARPFLGYFNRRFEDLHAHVDNPASLQHLEAVMHGRFEHLLREIRDIRTEIAADADTIAELAFTLERFADLFTARMEEVAGQISAAEATQWPEVTGAQLPFAFAASGALERGTTVATVGDDGTLSNGLAALGMHVTALEPTAIVSHADVDVVAGPLADWGGPAEPLTALFVLAGAQVSSAARPTREQVDLFRKWLAPSGLLVLGMHVAGGRGLDEDGVELLSDWDIRLRTLLEKVPGDGWRHSDDVSRDSIVLVRATPRV